jgi:hypothetical protein
MAQVWSDGCQIKILPCNNNNNNNNNNERIASMFKTVSLKEMKFIV